MKIRRSLHPANNRGVAILIVLSVITLMAVMVLSMFTMGKSETIGTRAEADMLHSRMLADTAVHLVVGQLREATSSKAGKVPMPWTSQPGAATTYDLKGGVKSVFKLYSAAEMVSTSMDKLANDIPSNWDRLPHQFVDLNAPTSLAPLKFPIVDPRAASANPTASVEGFSYTQATGVKLPEGDPNKQRLPMPVRWIYQLKDGTLGVLDASGEFDGPVAADNPIVGRFAFWTDDESCKINVNTASEGVYWDSPRVTSEEDRDLANFQPSRGEFQHYPGHAAQVSLSSVLFPNQRLHAPHSTSAKSSNGEMKSLSILAARGIWTLSPGIGANASQTTDGGRQKAAHIDDPNYNPPESIATPEHYHLYSSADELLYTADRQKQKLFVDYPEAETRLERGDFFLTAKSAAPETTLFGTPRICIWPVHGQVNVMGESHATPVERATPFDAYMAFTNTMGNRKYYVQRRDAKNGWWDFFKCNGGENQVLMEYLAGLTNDAFPGFYTDDNASFASKYGSGMGSDRAQILVSMLDYIRSTNLNDANLPWENQFSIICPGNPEEGYGQITPLSTIGGENFRTSVPLTEAQKHSARGLGRMLTISEVALVFGCRAEVGPDGKIKGSPSAANRAQLKSPGDREIEVGVMVEAFVPAQGWTEYRPYSSLALGGSATNGATELSAAIPDMMLMGKKLELQSSKASRTTSSGVGPPQRWLGWGGSAGYRCFTSNVIAFKPVVVPAGNETMQFSGTEGQTSTLQLAIYDDPASAAGTGTTGNVDITQIIPISLPAFQNLPMPELPTGTAFSLADRFAAAVNGAPLLSDKDVAQSLVPSHGDFRLLAASRQASAPSYAASPNAGRPMFVPHPAWGKTRFAHSFREPVGEMSVSVSSSYFPTIPQSPATSPDFTIAPFGAEGEGLLPMGNSFTAASLETIFQSSRLDGGARGVCAPHLTGDFDNGIGRAPDGPYINRPDDGDITGYVKGNAYFDVVSTDPAVLPKPSKSAFSPNRLISSPGMFGSLPTGVRAGVPWQTLLFRPWAQAEKTWNPSLDHYGFKTPRDHLLLDLFWMPTIEPYGISVPFATAGKINLNQQILPFRYIQRSTALHALFKSEKILAIPNEAAGEYKHPEKFSNARWRHFIDAAETLKLWETQRGSLKRNFLAPSEICEQYLVPEGETGTRSNMEAFWKKHLLTGDNSRERPYANLLSRLTTRSNTYKVYFKAQSIRKAQSSEPNRFDPAVDKISAEFTGTTLVERVLDPTRPDLPDYAAEIAAGKTPRPLDDYYQWRINQFHQTH